MFLGSPGHHSGIEDFLNKGTKSAAHVGKACLVPNSPYIADNVAGLCMKEAIYLGEHSPACITIGEDEPDEGMRVLIIVGVRWLGAPYTQCVVWT